MNLMRKQLWKEHSIELVDVGDPATGQHAVPFLVGDKPEPREPKASTSTRWQFPSSRPEIRQQGYAKLIHGVPTKHHVAVRGWRKSMLAVVGLASLVFVTNLALAIASTRLPRENGVGRIFEGPCQSVSRWDTGLHLLINVLGTLLLGAGNFTMQCLNSPNRSDVDIAHRKGISLDIGISSAKNLRHQPKYKGFLWCILALSTLPLHLFWNSTVFSTEGSNFFNYVIAEEAFVTQSDYEIPPVTCGYLSTGNISTLVDDIHVGVRAGRYSQLTPSQCFNDYTASLLLDRRNLILITQAQEGINATGCEDAAGLPSKVPWNGTSVVGLGSHSAPGIEWIFSVYGVLHRGYADKKPIQDRLEAEVKANGTWTLDQYPIQSCWSETKDVSHCQLQFAPALLWTVVACNFVKLLCIVVAALYMWDIQEPILATIGDSIASFLENPDHTTSGYCLLDAEDFKKNRWSPKLDDTVKEASIYTRKTQTRLFSATSKQHYWTSISICMAALLAGVALLAMSASGSAVLDRWGTSNTSHIIMIDGSSVSGIIRSALTANAFQLILSISYFLYNSLFTAQCSALEWTTFVGRKCRSLRVSYPQEEQRSTYWLQLPWKYSIPLMISLALMHFLISQCVFLARLQFFDSNDGLIPGSGYLRVGFSSSAILTAVCVGTVMVTAQLAHAARKIDNRIPIHGNHSVVISAACHAGGEGAYKVSAKKPIMWGVIRAPGQRSNMTTGMTTQDEIQEEPRHCGFTNDIVMPPSVGASYS